jgi:hypothetical protein
MDLVSEIGGEKGGDAQTGDFDETPRKMQGFDNI